jgi:hypothetical protein
MLECGAVRVYGCFYDAVGMGNVLYYRPRAMILTMSGYAGSMEDKGKRSMVKTRPLRLDVIQVEFFLSGLRPTFLQL